MQQRKIVSAAPSIEIPHYQAVALTAQSATAAAAYEKAIWAAFYASKLSRVRLVPAATVTGAAAGAVGLLNLWRGGVQVSTSGLLGVYNCAAVGANYTLAKLASQLVTPSRAFCWLGTIGAVTGGSSTGATATALGDSALNNGFVTATSRLIVDPGLPTEETIQLSAFNTGTGAFTIANSGTFATTHPAGAVVAVAGDFVWQGTTGAVTGGTSTSATLTATGASSRSGLITAGLALTFDPGLATQEVIPANQWTYNAGTGVVTLASTYNPGANAGKFISTHASGGQVVIAPQNAQPLLTRYLAGDVVTFKWLQLGTGLALPESVVFADYGL